MKKITAVFIILLLGTCSFVFSQGREFYKNIQIISPVIGLNSYTLPVGINLEYGLSRHIGIGGTALLWWWASQYWANSLISLSFDGAYHFTGLNVKNLDLFAGAGLGFSLYSYTWKDSHPGDIKGGLGSSGLYLKPFIGARYYFNRKTALFCRLYFQFMGDWEGAGGIIGVSFKIR